MEVKLTAVKRTPRIAKSSGKPFVSLGIKTDQHGDKWLSGFGGPENANWDVGQTVNIEVETRGEYLNFKTARSDSSPASKDAGLAEIKNILMLKVIPLLEAIYKQNPPIQKETKYDVEKADDISDSVPF